MNAFLSTLARSILPLAIFCLGTGTFHAEEAIPIRIDRPLRKGMLLQVNGTREMTTCAKLSVGGTVKKEETTKVVNDFALTVQVEEVDATGRITSATIAVGILTKQEKDQPKHDLATNGVTLHADRREGETTYVGAVLKDGKKLLDEVLPFALKPGEPDQDAVFGSREPRPVGATWDIDAAAMARLIKASGMGGAAEGIRGQMKLADRGIVNGVDCYLLQGALQVRSLTMPPEGMEGLPPGLRFHSGMMKQTMGGLFPLDVNSVDSSQEELGEATFVFKGGLPHSSAEATIVTDVRFHLKVVYRLLP